MLDASKARLVFMANPERKIIVVRPIGDLPPRVFIDRLFEAYGSLEAPWTFNRLNDFRRYDGYISDKDIAEIAQRWKILAAGQMYHAHVAVVSHDHFAKTRVPAISPLFPNETICLFGDFHEAMGWLTAPDKSAFFGTLAPAVALVREDSRIIVD